MIDCKYRSGMYVNLKHVARSFLNREYYIYGLVTQKKLRSRKNKFGKKRLAGVVIEDYKTIRGVHEAYIDKLEGRVGKECLDRVILHCKLDCFNMMQYYDFDSTMKFDPTTVLIGLEGVDQNPLTAEGQVDSILAYLKALTNAV